MRMRRYLRPERLVIVTVSGTRIEETFAYLLTFWLDIGSTHMMGAPIQIYPLYENGFRARRDQSFNDNNEESAVLYAKFSKVASNHPFAWNYGKRPMDAKEIGTVSKTNRMI